jgi:membrane protein implicated in regulation of membrane protease activity
VPIVAVWIIIAVLLVALEMHHGAFFAIFAAAGALAAAGVSAVSPKAYGVQIAVATAVAIAGILLVRPYVSRAFGRRSDGVHGGLVGAQAMSVDEITTHATGHVYLLGETWLAVTADGSTIAPGTPVKIADVRGTTLTVEPVAHKEN